MKEIKINKLIEGYKAQNLTDRQIKNRLNKEELKEEEQKNQKPVQELTINIEWKKSTIWGNCPRASAQIKYIDGTYSNVNGYKASGCGYDKESTVIAEIFNDFLSYKLWEKQEENIKQEKPYGIRFNEEYRPYYEGGVGTSCYYSISEFIGGTFENISSGKSFDVYKITMK